MTKPELKTYINSQGEFKKDPSNYAVKRNVINQDNMFHYQKLTDKLGLIFTGKTSGITVLDIDSKKIYNKLIKKYPELNQVFTVETYNGYHMYFLYDSDIKGTITDVFNKYSDIGEVDIRNDNDIITAPGTSYIVESGETFVYKYLGGELYKMPKQIKKLIKEQYFYSTKPEPKLESKKEYTKVNDETFLKMILMIDDDKADNYNNWITAGQAIYNTLGEEGRAYYHEFSQKSKKYDQKIVDKQYDTFKNGKEGGLTIGTLKKWAKEANPEEYKILFSNNKNFWDMMILFNNADLAEYYKDITTQKFIYCNDIWYAYNEFNVITKLSEKTPSQLISNISEVLRMYVG
jgi:hypothetical protein